HQPLPNASLEAVQQTWGFEDTAKIAPRALRAILVDFQNGEQSNVRRAFGYTTIFQPKKSVSRAQAAAALWYFGYQSEGVSAQEVLKGGESLKGGQTGKKGG
ncbi:MAG TPA: S-layer homology domain-containing protein, partial [Thermosynechococcaceae cyanobacterium]